VVAKRELLRIYLNDHRAGSVLGQELAKRALSENEGNEYGRFLSDLIREIEADRETLDELMRKLGFPRNRVKLGFAWTIEKLGRLKLNGRVTGYSPLSRLLELEGLSLGVAGKLAMWRALKSVSASEPELASFDLDRLIQRAESQRDGLERMRVRAAEDAFAAR
jgi:hypothetical protein